MINSIFENAAPLYAIADAQTCHKNNIHPVDFSKAFFESGGRLLQYRDKINNRITQKNTWEKIWKLSQQFNVAPVINDYIEIAREFQAPAHIGQDQKSEPGLYFGRSTHNIGEVIAAAQENPEPAYIGLGAMFSSSTKKQVPVFDRGTMTSIFKQWKKPVVYIGGITLENFHLLAKTPSTYYAIISDFFSKVTGGDSGAQVIRHIEQYTKSFLAKTNDN